MSDILVPSPPLWDFSLLPSSLCIFSSLDETFIVDVSNGVKFQPSIALANMHAEESVPSDVHQIQEPRSGGQVLGFAPLSQKCPGDLRWSPVLAALGGEAGPRERRYTCTLFK